jgi:hypothetical protein
MPHPIHIDEEHNKAIRAEVGERLRIIYWLEGRQRVPRPIRHSLDRLDEVEHRTERKTSVTLPRAGSKA